MTRFRASPPPGISQLTSLDGSVNLTPASGKGRVVDLHVSTGLAPANIAPLGGGSIRGILVLGVGVWCICGSGIGVGASTYTFVKTTNAGQSWTGFATGATQLIQMDFEGSTIIACDTSTANIYVSTNAGQTWSTISTAGATANAVAGCLISGGNYLITDGFNVYRSTNAGATWTLVATINNGTHPTAQFKGFGRVVFSSGGNGVKGLQYSDDNGATWVGPGTTGINITTARNCFAMISKTEWYAVANGLGLFHTTNSGGSWTNVDSSTTGTALACIATTPTRIVVESSIAGKEQGYSAYPWGGLLALAPDPPWSGGGGVCAIDAGTSPPKWLFGTSSSSPPNPSLTVWTGL